MDESIIQLQNQLAGEHEELKENLEVLEAKARELTDWRSQFEKRPLLLLGLAFGGGLIASSLVGGRRRSRRAESGDERSTPSGTTRQPSTGNPGWRKIRQTLSAVASGAAVELLHEALPGFKERYERVKEHVAEASRGNDGGIRPIRTANEPGLRGQAYNAPDSV